jgi:hypothetical protein
MKLFYCHIIALLLIALMACKPKEPMLSVHSGTADFSKFVAIGDGHTAGYMDDALSLHGQQNALGTLLQMQLQLAGANPTILPWLDPSNVGINTQQQARLMLGYKTDCMGIQGLSPIRFSAQGEVVSFTQSAYIPNQKYSNYGIPGLKMIDMVSNLIGNPNDQKYNPYFGRMSMDQFVLPMTGTWSSVQENVLFGGYPTFSSIYLGLEDLLPYAKSGATQNPMTPVSGLPNVGFDESINQLLSQLSSNNAKGVIATLPDVTKFPYFTTIPYNGLKLDAASVVTLNQIYGPLGFAFHVGENPFMIEDPSAGMFGVRPMLPGELILLSVPLDSIKCHQMGSVFPLRDEFVLTLDEIQQVQSRTTAFNQIIRAKANEVGFAVVETSPFYEKTNAGFVYNGASLSAKFVSGGVFSLDGIHLNPRGNALLTNEFLKAINVKFKSNLPMLNALNYNSVLFP